MKAQTTSSIIAHGWQELRWSHLLTERRGWYQGREPKPLKERQPCQGCPKAGHPRCKMPNPDSLLESRSLYPMVWGRECSHSKGQWGELYASLGQWCTDQHCHARVCWNSLSGFQASLRPCMEMSSLCRSGKHPYLTPWLHHYMGSSRWSQGIQWGSQIALIVLELSNFMARVPAILGSPTIGCIMNVIKEN